MDSEIKLLPLNPPPTAPIHARIKAQPDDFIVEEMPQYEPSGSGTHTWLWIEKRELTTHDAARKLAEKLGKRHLDAGIAGLKDAQAVSRQWITFEHVTQPPEELMQISDERLRVLKVSRHANKLRMGHLRGNRFIIRLRTEQTELLARAEKILAALAQSGIPNYFGPQRFGWGGGNTELGRFLVRGDEAGFRNAFAKSSQGKPDRKIRNLLVNAFQSELFNRVLALRMPAIGALQAGDLACLHRNGAVFKVGCAADVEREQPRADAHEISPSGPIFGPEMIQPEGVPGEIEAQVLRESSVSLADFGRREAERQPGARRPLRVFFLDLPQASADPDGVLTTFSLPSGAYATVVLREILGE